MFLKNFKKINCWTLFLFALSTPVLVEICSVKCTKCIITIIVIIVGSTHGIEGINIKGLIIGWQDYPGEEILIVYDPEFKHGQNFFIATTEEAKQLLLKVCIVPVFPTIALPPDVNFISWLNLVIW